MENWNSLEIAKLIVQAMIPIVIVSIGFWLNRRLKELEQLQWASQKLIEKRIEFYYRVVPKLNDLLCFYTYVGNWKELKPVDVIDLKRFLDKEFHINAPLFPSGIFFEYETFVNLCYKSFTGWGQDAKLRTQFSRRKETFKTNWDINWESRFDLDENEKPSRIRDSYKILVESLANSLGIGKNLSNITFKNLPRSISENLLK